MPKLDPLLMRADIARVETERPDLDHTIVRGLYEHFFDVQGRQPTLVEFHDYVDHITSSIEWLDLWERFSAHEPTEEERAGLLEGVTPGAPPVTMGRRPRHPGRPGWTAELFWARYREALAKAPPPRTYRVVAPLFVALDGTEGTSPEYLRKLVRRFGLPPR